jgi:predicted Zn-dependent protease
MGLHLTEGYDRAPGTNSTAYNPGEPSLNMGLVRWEPKKMPLKVWISPGLSLPDLSFSELQKVRPDQVYQMLVTQQDPQVNPNGDPFFGLPVANGWTPDTNVQVQAGISEWSQFQNEGLFSFTFTDNPREAQIMVFFVDAFRDSTSPGGIMVGGNTCAQVYPLAQAMSVNIQQKPVIIELSTLVNSTPEKMLGATAHEFGHALGIKAHSPYRDDIMHENRIVTQLSPADKATIRRLYKSKPAYVM